LYDWISVLSLYMELYMGFVWTLKGFSPFHPLVCHEFSHQMAWLCLDSPHSLIGHMDILDMLGFHRVKHWGFFLKNNSFRAGFTQSRWDSPSILCYDSNQQDTCLWYNILMIYKIGGCNQMWYNHHGMIGLWASMGLEPILPWWYIYIYISGQIIIIH
jgi:hypothetical protein